MLIFHESGKQPASNFNFNFFGKSKFGFTHICNAQAMQSRFAILLVQLARMHLLARTTNIFFY